MKGTEQVNGVGREDQGRWKCGRMDGYNAGGDEAQTG